jgi:hypothetical protein
MTKPMQFTHEKGYPMKSTIQLFLVIQAAVFAFAAGAHFGIVGSMDDPGAGTAETVIGVVLLAGLALTFTRGANVRAIALAAQGFALLGTLVGFTLVITVGPTRAFDVTVHGIMLVLLVTGLAVTYRSPQPEDNGTNGPALA